MTYGIVGVGAIAAAIVTGLCEQVRDAPAIVLSPRNASRAADLASRFPTVRVARSNQEVIDGSSVLLLCIRPQDARSVLSGLKFSSQQPIVSMLAGISIEALHAARSAGAEHCSGHSAAVGGRTRGCDADLSADAKLPEHCSIGSALDRDSECSGVRGDLGLHGDDRRALRLSEQHLPMAHCARRFGDSSETSGRCHFRRTGGDSCGVRRRTLQSSRATTRHEAASTNSSWACWNRRAYSMPWTPG